MTAARTVVPVSTKVLIATVVASAGLDFTIRRTRGAVSCASDQTSAIEDQIGALGMVVVTDIAITQGVASLPGPVTEQNDDDWFVWEPIIGLAASVPHPGEGGSFRFDSKAMRRLPDGNSVAVILENASGAHVMEVAWAFSMLTSIS